MGPSTIKTLRMEHYTDIINIIVKSIHYFFYKNQQFLVETKMFFFRKTGTTTSLKLCLKFTFWSILLNGNALSYSSEVDQEISRNSSLVLVVLINFVLIKMKVFQI